MKPYSPHHQNVEIEGRNKKRHFAGYSIGRTVCLHMRLFERGIGLASNTMYSIYCRRSISAFLSRSAKSRQRCFLSSASSTRFAFE
jgi:hypothetical protein